MKIDINGVSITLTDEQLAEIARQANKFRSYKDIKTLENAYKHLGKTLPDYTNSILRKREIALRHLEIVVEAIRSFTNWKPVWSNSSQRKYRVWFDLEKGFSCYDANCNGTSTFVPSALYVGTEDEAIYLGETFLDLFKDYILSEE